MLVFYRDFVVIFCGLFFVSLLCARHSNIDMIIIREQTEGEYTSLEHEVWLSIFFVTAQESQASIVYIKVYFQTILLERIEDWLPGKYWVLFSWEPHILFFMQVAAFVRAHWGNQGKKLFWFLCGTVLISFFVLFRFDMSKFKTIVLTNSNCKLFLGLERKYKHERTHF